GLVLALFLTRMGIPVRIIDKAPQPAAESRALAVQARTPEFYRQVGLAEAVIAQGHLVPAVNLWVQGRKKATIPLSEIGKGMSPYSFLMIYPQDEHERLLIDELCRLGVEVERPVELEAFTEDADGIHATVR